MPVLRIVKVFVIVCTFMGLWHSLTMINAKPINNKQNTANMGEIQQAALNETFFGTQKPPMPATLNTDAADDAEPSEIQKAVCTVTAGDVKASAEAVTTKALKGVCAANEMKTSFVGLEQKLFKELELLEGRLYQELENIKNLLTAAKQQEICNKTDITPTKSIVLLQPIPQTNNNEIKTATTISKIKTKTFNAHPSVKPTKHSTTTLAPEKNGKFFIYSWRIDNFTQKIENNSEVIVQTSPPFSIKGKNLKVKASFQHLHRDFLYLQLIDVSASLHGTSGNSVILDTGGMFKQITSGNLKYKMSIVVSIILGIYMTPILFSVSFQNSSNGKDLVSQEFDNHESGFLIPNSALLDSPFIKDDSLSIKVIFY
ncbi:uncharacterized protein [Musca autumnalis]|uniref:uncharacterized protein n=1 Tax=Musca autumnalis TaxID=221902 RepID=UPI003CE85475